MVSRTHITDLDSNWLLRWISVTLKVSTLVSWLRRQAMRPQNWINWTVVEESRPLIRLTWFPVSHCLSATGSKCGSSDDNAYGVVPSTRGLSDYIRFFFSSCLGQDGISPRREFRFQFFASLNVSGAAFLHPPFPGPWSSWWVGVWFLEVSNSVHILSRGYSSQA